MLKRIRQWRETQRRERAAVDRALEHFRRARGIEPSGGYILHRGDHETVVRVMYHNGHIPPDRAWFAVSADLATVRELSFADVEALQRPWR